MEAEKQFILTLLGPCGIPIKKLRYSLDIFLVLTILVLTCSESQKREKFINGSYNSRDILMLYNPLINYKRIFNTVV